ncbi:MAG TPA: hypothetical protein VEP68_09690 [Anaeromyxobacteraceae bacterium]|nr:hypothetical protein [Anaeromyxobacteraceae bacterium]
MDAAEKEVLWGEVDALERDLAAERFRIAAGLEAEPALSAIYAAHGAAAHRSTVARLRAEGEPELAGRVAALRAERAAAEGEEAWRAAEASALAQGPDGPVPLARAELAVAGERDRERRLAFGRAAAAAIAASSVAGEAAAEQRARARVEVGLLPDWEAVVAADEVLDASEDGYRDVLAWLARREISLAPGPRGDLDRSDLVYLLALRRWDGLFPRGMLAPVLRQATERLGLALSRIRVEEGDRPAQWPGAHAFEERISFRRRGGAPDWLDLLRAAGEALAAAACPPRSRQPAFPAALGSLLLGLLLEPAFLSRTLGVERSGAGDLVRALALSRLFALRASAAALRVAAEVERGSSGTAWRQAHREALSAAALAAWPDGLAARDAAADRHRLALEGAAWGERLRVRLVEAHDEDWWRNPRAAATLAGWLAAGRAGPDEERPPLAAAARALTGRLGG